MDLHIDSFSVVGCTVPQPIGINYIAQEVRNVIAVIIRLFCCVLWSCILAANGCSFYSILNSLSFARSARDYVTPHILGSISDGVIGIFH